MHQFYQEAISVCNAAKLKNPKSHNCYKHWAFALFKKGELHKAVKKLQKGMKREPHDADYWVIWGVISKTTGDYEGAKHKFLQALHLDPLNDLA
eukprot:CAMPEP_0202973874 /NCGR_PEP_ID=MMETSP1396-20130829/54878_1 /ASSEMBLY_ACC=CAM_ASM_000872 /TAXON_ID= /ORGANISM="Pseudokeronopsis sp., Strain Brazil" /LENGTH=93 /DNA_ID=CAMNT_0049706711 /DNA_START=440 /DNA_END=721 /DNA_ORIENTATION=+